MTSLLETIPYVPIFSAWEMDTPGYKVVVAGYYPGKDPVGVLLEGMKLLDTELDEEMKLALNEGDSIAYELDNRVLLVVPVAQYDCWSTALDIRKAVALVLENTYFQQADVVYVSLLGAGTNFSPEKSANILVPVFDAYLHAQVVRRPPLIKTTNPNATIAISKSFTFTGLHKAEPWKELGEADEFAPYTSEPPISIEDDVVVKELPFYAHKIKFETPPVIQSGSSDQLGVIVGGKPLATTKAVAGSLYQLQMAPPQEVPQEAPEMGGSPEYGADDTTKNKIEKLLSNYTGKLPPAIAEPQAPTWEKGAQKAMDSLKAIASKLYPLDSNNGSLWPGPPPSTKTDE